ncbi:TetR/AcrR family transcriptional regulator [bacterium BMS3Abin03]|jgi:TetR/AcrR family transcriptional regulator|nr:TetR/AcrR family transcriptional regulator [bacterium BMS3Abin03]MCG6958933.1 TetR/AcrR family transcriptional regulator [bacterium BMS3Abin03]
MSKNSPKEKEIIEAARNRFAHYGFSKVTMEEVALDVGMGKASLYYYFPNKEDLFKSVIQKEQDLFVEEIKNLIRQNLTATKKLEDYVSKRLEYFQQLINLATLNVHSFVDIKSMFKELFKSFEDQELLLLQKIFDEGKSKGEFDKSVTEKTTRIFLHLLQGLRLRIIKSININRTEKVNYAELREETMRFVNIFSKGIESS